VAALPFFSGDVGLPLVFSWPDARHPWVDLLSPQPDLCVPLVEPRPWREGGREVAEGGRKGWLWRVEVEKEAGGDQV
jgi:hypothetical protein